MNNDNPPPIPGSEPSAPAPHPLPDSSKLRDLFEALLRRPADLAGHECIERPRSLANLGIMALVSMLVFGFVLGTFAYHEQLWAAPLKLGAGLLFAGLICYPSLYIFSCLAGSTASAGRLGSLLGAMLALAGLLLLGFAPAVWIFTQGTRSFGFMGTLSVGSWLVALVFAFRFILTALRVHGAKQKGPLAIWCFIFLLVTLQLTTSLRPILGTSDRFLTDEKKFFLQHWAESAGENLPDTTIETAANEGPFER
ncbi:hypothetical protein HAHE_05470 [Haloferula helveola]|uniref:Yip1 domain-containing protein n=1 Tax=Haloferula helveola TaxID=490095 RepID=A0ABN6GZC3_9BACT|nr:hypothetical protein HAHE_05470 [Haloferula helveola]